MTLNVAVGPFPNTAHDQWPISGCGTLLPDFEIVPFFTDEMAPDADALVVWSPEYLDGDYEDSLRAKFGGYKACFLGDWHIRVPDHLYRYDAIFTDWRGVGHLKAKGYSPEQVGWFRGFSFDPRLHRPNVGPKDISVAFLGRPVPERHPFLLRIVEWGKSTGNPVYVTTDPYERGKEAEYYRRSKIVWTKSQRSELPMRVYESAACGALALIELDNAELYQSGAPLAGWTDSLLEAQLDEWVRNDAAREAKVREQYAWVAKESPSRHLAFLCRAIKERMEQSGHSTSRTSRVDTPVPSDSPVLLRESVGTIEAPVDYSQIDPPENERREEVCALVPMEAKTILDLGCHQGGLLHHLRKTREGLYTVGVDLNPSARERCVHRMDEYHEYDLEQYRGYNVQPWSKRQYDCIIAADVLEHVKDPWGVVGALRDLLAPGGCIVASIPNIRNTANLFHTVVMGEWRYHVHSRDEWRGPQDNVLSVDHLRFFTKEAVERLFTDAGYVIEQWGATYLGAPQLEQWTQDLGALIGKYGGNVSDWGAQSHVIQFLIRARLPA